MQIKMLMARGDTRLYQVTFTHWEARVLCACLKWVPLSKVMQSLAASWSNAAIVVRDIYTGLSARVEAEQRRAALIDDTREEELRDRP